MRLLLVEDDDRIAGPLSEGLCRHGFTVDRAATGAAALTAATADLVLLDLGLPDMDGLDVCRTLRSRSAAPIIMITARSEETDRAACLAVGADDYLVKPFGVRELVARIRAVSRRARPRHRAAHATTDVRTPDALTTDVRTTDLRTADVQRVGPLTIDRRTRQVTVGEEPLALSPKEFSLLACLADDPGAVWHRRQIMDEVWGPHFFDPTKTLDVHVAALRRKLGGPSWITAVPRIGFRLATPSGSGGSSSSSKGSGKGSGNG
ncbi:response regulator transcription factor [Streptomyces sp. CWNU-52B]|uniref:response regulator transcription factor n=1 Tax=unclassified Streptomyces TaxID=2593676 RepID=UPI0039BFBC82